MAHCLCLSVHSSLIVRLNVDAKHQHAHQNNVNLLICSKRHCYYLAGCISMLMLAPKAHLLLMGLALDLVVFAQKPESQKKLECRDVGAR